MSIHPAMIHELVLAHDRDLSARVASARVGTVGRGRSSVGAARAVLAAQLIALGRRVGGLPVSTTEPMTGATR
jgi:hypothetical protein